MTRATKLLWMVGLGAGCHVVSGLDDFRPGGTPSGAATTSSAGGAGGTGGSSEAGGGGWGGSASDWDEGIVVRYYMAEADSGTGPVALIDAGTAGLNLPIAYESNSEYVETAGNRGLEWKAMVSGGRASAPLDAAGAAVVDALNGSTRATIEAVFELDDSSAQCPRLIDISHDTTAELGQLAICFENDELELRLNDSRVVEAPAAGVVATGRHVVHAVIDSEVSDPAGRARLYLDGELLSWATNAPTLGETIVVSTEDTLTVGNRFTSDRSPDGRIYYAAIYDMALEETRVGAHADWLATADDEAPP